MKLCIHRGTRQIGGTCVEIESQGKRLVLDVGLPLDCPDPESLPLPPVRGFDQVDDSLLGVLISHSHQDHYGLAQRLPPETTFLIGAAAQRILDAATLFSPSGLQLKNTLPLTDRQPIALGPFTITPYLVDHSAYDAYAVLIEADGKRLFYSGDFRAHGRKANVMDRLIENPPANVHRLLMEGTCLGREDRIAETEDDLVPQLVNFFQQTPGMPLVWCSGQNIDRLVTIFKACRRAGRQFIIDMYTAEILRATGNERIPQSHWDSIRVFLPEFQKRRVIRLQGFDVAKRYSADRIYWEQLAAAAPNSVLLFRPSMMFDIDRAKCHAGASLVNSMWPGYLTEPPLANFRDWLDQHQIHVHHCHTSGHATLADLLRFRNAFPTTIATPVHLTERERFATVFGNVELRDDGEWWEI